MKQRRMVALFTALAVFFSLIFSAVLPSAASDHVHENEETCVVCATVQECKELQRTLSTAADTSERAELPSPRGTLFRTRASAPAAGGNVTLVSLKVKLTD